MDRFELKITLGICSIFLLCCQSLALSNGPKYLQNYTKSCYGDFMLLSPTGAGPKTSSSTGQIGRFVFILRYSILWNTMTLMISKWVLLTQSTAQNYWKKFWHFFSGHHFGIAGFLLHKYIIWLNNTDLLLCISYN